MRSWIISLSLSVSVLLGFTGLAHAEEIVILQMKDGRYYHPATGTIDASRDAILSKLGKTAEQVTEIGQAPVILQMKDGRFYHPATGTIASSKDEIMRQLGFASDGTPVPVVSQSNLPRELQAVYRAQEELRAQIRAEGKDVRYKMQPIGQDAPRNVTLAVWNESTDAITYVQAVKQGSKLTVQTPAPAGITVRVSNWINSDYAINDPKYAVVAVRYPIFNEIKQGTKVVEYAVEEAVYTPYSSKLHRPVVVKEGMRLVDTMVDTAFDELRARGAKSRAIDGKLVADVVEPDLVKAIAVIEHVDGASLRNNAERAVERVYATVALNPGQAYNYAKSSAGALGMFQFIPSTYTSQAKNRPELGLKPDFEAGMKDHHNATKASIGYMDTILAYLPETVQANHKIDPKTYEYLAASYNGGYGRVRTAIQIWDEQISGELKPAQILKRSRLQPETIDYVKKLRNALPAIRAMHAGSSS